MDPRSKFERVLSCSVFSVLLGATYVSLPSGFSDYPSNLNVFHWISYYISIHRLSPVFDFLFYFQVELNCLPTLTYFESRLSSSLAHSRKVSIPGSLTFNRLNNDYSG